MTELSFSLDCSLLKKTSPESLGISAETETKTAQDVARVQQVVAEKLQSQAYGFVNTLDNPSILEDIRATLRTIEWAHTVVVLGIGGSDLGARALQQALVTTTAGFDVRFHGDSTDPVALTKLLSSIEVTKTVIIVISKSGETVETISQYVYLKAYLQTHLEPGESWQQHFIFITDAQKGILRTEADTHQVTTLAIPDDVGGRFSVQTTVGLLPAGAMGIDLEAFLAGARDFIQNQEGQALALQLATTQYQLFTQGTKVVVFMPYSTQLEETARWFRQLWAESLGKQRTGILPIQARGPADQHSQLQFYAEGSPLQSVLFLRVEERPDPMILQNVDVAGVEYLAGHSFHEIINAEQHATATSLAELGRPSATLSLKKIDAYTLGQLMLFFELSVVYLAEFLGVNAFDQPGVEKGKQLLYAALGKTS